MSVFIELVVEDYDTVVNAENKKWRRGAGVDSVRRPLRGLEIKDDTHAVIRVIGPNGFEIPLVSSSYPTGEGPDYTNFILQSVVDAREEKTQIIETFGDAYVFFFGERPRFLNVSAILINSFDFNWKAEFEVNYEKYLRGTKCAELGARVYLFYDDNIVSGYMMKAQMDENAGSPMQVGLSFVLFVTTARNISFVSEGNRYPVRPSGLTGTDPVFEVAGLTEEGVSATQLPTWLEQKELGKQYTTYHQTYGMLESGEVPRFDLPVRSNIVDNVDEWTGDRFAYRMNEKWIEYEEKQLKRKLQNEAIKRACQAGAFANNAGMLRGFGLTGPGDSLSWGDIEDAWSTVKKGDVEKIASNLVTSNVTTTVNTPWGSGVATAGTSPGEGSYSGSDWKSTSELEKAHAGAGAGYYGGGAVGYNPFAGEVPGPAGAAGYYSGSGYFGPDQRGVPGYGAGSMPAGTNQKCSAGAWAGWSSSSGWTSGSYSYPGGQAPHGAHHQSAITGTAGLSGSASATASFGLSASGGAYVGGAAGGGYASGYRPGGDNPATADSMYYAAGGASWDPDNGFQWDSTTDPDKPVPGQPGGGVFNTQALGGSMYEDKWKPDYESTGIYQGASQLPYGQKELSQCGNKRGTSLGF